MDGINISEFAKRIQKLDALYPRLPNIAATLAVQFSKDRFREQAWADVRTEPWKKRKEIGAARRRNQGRAILVKSGRLKRSIRKIRTTPTLAVISTDVPYAAAHNYGFRGSVTGKSSTGKTFTRHMTLPRRQFLGESMVLARRIERQFTAELIRAIR
jgi:phage gpG-like protein